jgi:hypothetical protein
MTKIYFYLHTKPKWKTREKVFQKSDASKNWKKKKFRKNEKFKKVCKIKKNNYLAFDMFEIRHTL